MDSDCGWILYCTVWIGLMGLLLSLFLILALSSILMFVVRTCRIDWRFSWRCEMMPVSMVV